ncbi:MAG TPA: hypothetical protein PLX71_10130, partial [Phycicoccus sp.]|nr:hypothetical protein [Phycicoccus sp.]
GPGWHPPQPAPADDKAEDRFGIPSPGRHATVNPNQDNEAEPRRSTPTGHTHATSPPPLLGPGCHPPPHLADDGPPLSTLVDIIWTPNSGLEIHLDAA